MPKSFHFGIVFKGILLASGIALLLSFILGLLLTLTQLQESSLVYNIILGISVFIAAAISAHHAGMKGLFYGIGIGVGFILLLLFSFTVLSPDTPSWLSFGEKSIIILAAGAVGGIIGVVARG
ncbi:MULTISPECIES: TIGR04086 family membrane protein [Desulfitobacterium]|uniref:Putative membrane protein, TIGR04086 family/integral membrane protein, TIGR04097 family n=1 Tax=Desulfitobacterium dehalogenans (strain ATCC 51507 / DSM 9161 / JW/IU-DC1) TaxID=756499 RepID=I4AA06_DESDJ|nr:MULTISPECIES: TIGR04086 family membrane protein [Desulfitobacterium]AFM00791.1 putative membrane protein, TIGR04086 family/integral membrane protein, TIGR04097 family [Desulfitobacterium dehalogenans ATCC 51507]